MKRTAAGTALPLRHVTCVGRYTRTLNPANTRGKRAAGSFLLLFIFSFCKCLLNVSEILRDFVGCSFLFIACDFLAHYFHLTQLERRNDLLGQRPLLPQSHYPGPPTMPLTGKGGLTSCDNTYTPPPRVVLAYTLGFSAPMTSGHRSCLLEEGLNYSCLTNAAVGPV